MLLSIRWPQILAFRLARQHLAPLAQADPALLTSGACGIQAQVLSAAEMGLWARNHSLTREKIQAALWKSRSLVKTQAMRGTLHLLPTFEYALYMRALRRSRLRQMRQIMGRYGVSRKVSDRVTEAVIEALSEGPLSRPELTERILAQGLAKGKSKAWFEQSWWGVTRQAMVEGLVCYGPDQGRNVTLVLTGQWLPRQETHEREQAQMALFRSYLSSYGPATVRDFCKWSGMNASEVRPIRKKLGEELVQIQAEGKPAWLLRRDLEALQQQSSKRRHLRLLPYFDGYLLGHAKKDLFLESTHYKRVFRQAGWVSPVVLLNGKVIGVWSLTQRSKHILVEIEPFEKLSQPVQGLLEREAASLGTFLGNPAQTIIKK